MTRPTETARRLRRDATAAERRLWRALREAKLAVRFRRQHPIGRHIADFACPAARLVVELDGGQHAMARSADADRAVDLSTHGYRVLRFWNNEVMEDVGGVLATIIRAVAAAGPTSPSPPRRGGSPPSPP
ncbi:MAG: DUF559 domain-containing protein [Alphaproteobacteria bacterium]|nr:DUF559 domain-containing protein [Alphaproteobacteria bacterium]